MNGRGKYVSLSWQILGRVIPGVKATCRFAAAPPPRHGPTRSASSRTGWSGPLLARLSG
jgi:hypothetical protein